MHHLVPVLENMTLPSREVPISITGKIWWILPAEICRRPPGHAYAALGLCKNMAVEHRSDLAPQFKAAGVTMEELQEQLSHIREQLAQIKPEDEEDQNEADLIQKNVEQAETIVKSTYAAVEKRGE